ncbi:hypothetical protein T492DRAFT_1114373 [Pavlovales sp. CCMP2436]|nr:hypothetical protein T492DRAFT_1114373 [Pavlovales sp. CCMP2436]
MHSRIRALLEDALSAALQKLADTERADTGAADTERADTGRADTEMPTGAADTEPALRMGGGVRGWLRRVSSRSTDSLPLPLSADTGATDTGAADTGAADTGAADTGAANAGAADTSVPDTDAQVLAAASFFPAWACARELATRCLLADCGADKAIEQAKPQKTVRVGTKQARLDRESALVPLALSLVRDACVHAAAGPEATDGLFASVLVRAARSSEPELFRKIFHKLRLDSVFFLREQKFDYYYYYYCCNGWPALFKKMRPLVLSCWPALFKRMRPLELSRACVRACEFEAAANYALVEEALFGPEAALALACEVLGEMRALECDASEQELRESLERFVALRALGP